MNDNMKKAVEEKKLVKFKTKKGKSVKFLADPKPVDVL